jgi:hypothetical protein
MFRPTGAGSISRSEKVKIKLSLTKVNLKLLFYSAHRNIILPELCLASGRDNCNVLVNV